MRQVLWNWSEIWGHVYAKKLLQYTYSTVLLTVQYYSHVPSTAPLRNNQPRLLETERSQWKWYLIRMPPGRLPLEVFWASPAGMRPWGRPRTRWRDCVSFRAWNISGSPRTSGEVLLGRGRSLFLSWTYYISNLIMDKR